MVVLWTGTRGRPRTLVPLPPPIHAAYSGQEAAGVACNRDTSVGAVRPGWLCSRPSQPPCAPSHPQEPWRLGRPSPSTLGATPAQPATPWAWPTSRWSSLCKVRVPPDSPGLWGTGVRGELEALGAGEGGEDPGFQMPLPASDLSLRGLLGRTESALLCRAEFPVEASLSGA